MKTQLRLVALALLFATLEPRPSIIAFEGRISAALTRGSDTQTFLYTASSNVLRIDRGETNWPHAANIVELANGETTLLFPHNRSFVRIKLVAETESAASPGFPVMPALPPGAGQQLQMPTGPSFPAPVGPTNLPGGAPQMPRIPPMPRMPGGAEGGLSAGMPVMAMMMPSMGMPKMQLKSTGEKTNLLGFVCEKYELRQRDEVMEIWATDQLLAFQPWLATQPHRFGEGSMEERWGDLLKAKRLFPLRAVLRIERTAAAGQQHAPPKGPERMRFEVKFIALGQLGEKDGCLFQPPPDYHEVAPLPF